MLLCKVRHRCIVADLNPLEHNVPLIVGCFAVRAEALVVNASTAKQSKVRRHVSRKMKLQLHLAVTI